MSTENIDHRTKNRDQGIIPIRRDTNLVLTWVKQYLLDCRAHQLATGTVKFYRAKLNQFVRYCTEFDVMVMEDINPHLLRAFLVHLEDTGHNPGCQ